MAVQNFVVVPYVAYGGSSSLLRFRGFGDRLFLGNATLYVV